MLIQYKEAIESTNIISKTDINGVITFVNDEFCAISGYSKEELLGKNHNIIRHPDVDDEKFKTLWQTILDKKTYKDTVKNLAKDGSVFYVNTTIIPILDENSDITEFVAIRYDVTKELLLKEQLIKKEIEYEELNKSLEKRVEVQTKELKKLNQTLEKRVNEEIEKNEEKQRIMFWQSRHASLGQMIANIAHQWRQPLMELSLAMFSIKKAALNQNTQNITKFYDESMYIIKNMSQTIEDFSNFFKPDRQKHYFNVSEAIKESITLLESAIDEAMINIKCDLDNMEVLGVTNEFTQIIINLINNSKDAFIKNGILFREINISAKKEGEFAVIELSDNAGGIPKDVLDRIFEPYFTTKHKSRGTGLGLFMSKMICEQGLGGSMDVVSKKNETTFTIKIPLGKIG